MEIDFMDKVCLPALSRRKKREKEESGGIIFDKVIE
jgi:hypothetical protein